MSELTALGNGYIISDGDSFPGFIDSVLGDDGNIDIIIYQANNSEPKALIRLSLKSAILFGRSLSHEIQEQLIELKAMVEGSSNE